ncbi:alpha-amylase family glycosyl hydrolase [Spirosoma soli]|uniref:Alpha-amylase family glycosyl hydrolase n=1 Tax=Spirosoma soli TaxID=1770529 RepID=A0ABW5MBW3_9BACT
MHFLNRYLLCFGLLATQALAQSGSKPTGQSRPGHTGVHYEIFVRSFADSNGDGIGDLNGVTSRLDYLKDLGISAIWLMPISPSPSYHKYDVTDYYGIDPEYGTMADFKRLLTEAHRRNIKVIIDFVINHSSNQHPWFRDAASGPTAAYRNWYVWMTQAQIDSLNLSTREATADSGERSPWHVANNQAAAKYYGMFWSGMPDLNYDEPAVRQEIYKTGKFWLTEVGVDGFRLDAARHIYPDQDEPKNHQFWAEFGRTMEQAKPGTYTVGEVWAKADQVAPYFQGLKANFNFDLSFALQKLVAQENDSVNVVAMLAHNRAIYAKANPQFIDATMLTNHDQNRIGSVLNGNLNHEKVAASLLLTLPGNPYLYYGEELGMLGRKPDETIREPFLWDRQPQDKQRTRWMKPTFTTDSSVAPLSRQQADPTSLFAHYKRLIQFRNSHAVLNDNLSQLAETGIRQAGVVAFVRQSGKRSVLVVQNLTGKPISVGLTPSEQAYRKITFQSVNGAGLAKNQLTIPAYGCTILE